MGLVAPKRMRPGHAGGMIGLSGEAKAMSFDIDVLIQLILNFISVLITYLFSEAAFGI